MPLAVSDIGRFNTNLPEEFLSIIPSNCRVCDSDMIINETLTSLKCSNPRCNSKFKMRIKAICKDNDIKGFGEAAIEGFLDMYNPSSPMNIFELQLGMPLGEGIGEGRSNEIISQLAKIRDSREYLLWELVKMQHLPGIQKSAQHVFKGFTDIDEAYEMLESGGVEFVHERLYGEVVDSVGINSIKVYTTLMEFEDDIKEAVSYFNILSSRDQREVTIVASDQVGNGFSTKNEFYNYCKDKFGDKYHFNFEGSVSKRTTEALIWAGADGSDARYTSKVQKVESYNEKGASIPILTGAQFIEFMESGRDFEQIYMFFLEKRSEVPNEDEYVEPRQVSSLGML